MGGFLLITYLLGFPIAIPLYILAYMMSHGTSWLVAASCGIGTSAAVYCLFGLALGMDLHRGLVFTWLGF